MANASLQIGNGNWAIKEDNLLGYSKSGTRFLPIPITMTRATLGTRVNPSGLIENVALLGDELITNGGFTRDTDWIKSPSGVTIDGSGFAYFTSGQDTYVFQSIMTIGKQYSISLDYNITSITSGYFGSNFGSGNAILSMAGLSGSGTLSGIITATNSIIIIRSSTFDGTITNVTVKEYTTNNLARVDYTDGTASLLVEPQRTNRFLYSEDLTQFNLSSSGTGASSPTVTSNYGISPDGTQNADRVQFNAGTDSSGNSRITETFTIFCNRGNYKCLFKK